ncbi:MAG TPA: ATP-binding protein [Actinomycetota bacterium]|nr:ATP-binding protein [Actinomycetota bacterium]
MRTASEALRVLTNVAYVTLALLAFVQWVRRRSEQAAWIAASFASLAFVVSVSWILPQGSTSGPEQFLRKLQIAVLTLFPYLLYRFTSAFGSFSRVWERLVLALAGGLATWTFLLPWIPAQGEERPSWYVAFVSAFLTFWVTVSVLSAVRLIRAGRGQPTVARRRMRLLAFGAILVSLVLLISGAASPSLDPTPLRLLIQAASVASAVVFYLGFAMPRVLRSMWRRPEEARFRSATLELMGVTTAEEVAEALLPHVVGIVGARGAVLGDHDHEPLAVIGLSREEGHALLAAVRRSSEPGALVEGDSGVLSLAMRSGVLAIQASPYTPFFGQEELELVQGIGAFSDVALERAQLFVAERRAREEVQQASAELENFVYSVSHDLKSPLISVLGYLDLLRMEHREALGERGTHYLDRIAASAVYMNRLILDLLELSRIGRVQTDVEEVDLGQLVSEVFDELRPAHREARFEAGDLPALRMNPLRARQLFTNLIGNAVIHAGRPDVSVRVWHEIAEERFAVVVADDGQGIPPAYHEKVFGVFERLEGTTSDASSGTGIGLAVCKKIVEQVGGSIELGFPERGTHVVVTLPADIVRTGAAV